MNEGKVFAEVTDEGRAFQTVGAARLKALLARMVLEEGTASRFLLAEQCAQICVGADNRGAEGTKIETSKASRGKGIPQPTRGLGSVVSSHSPVAIVKKAR